MGKQEENNKNLLLIIQRLTSINVPVILFVSYTSWGENTPGCGLMTIKGLLVCTSNYLGHFEHQKEHGLRQILFMMGHLFLVTKENIYSSGV